MTIRPLYAIATMLLLATEAAIALFVDDRFVGPFVGDSLAVILIYCAVRTVTRRGVAACVTLALAAAVVIEFGQLFGLLDLIGLRGNPIARVVLGTGFDLMDFVAYAAGAVCVLAIERLRGNPLSP